jgi:peptidoglycan lytic transglycosylase
MTLPLGKRLTLGVIGIAALAAPTVAAGDPGTGGSQAPPPPQTERTLSASGPQITVTTRAGTMRRKLARFRGSVSPSAAGRTVTIESLDGATLQWAAITSATVNPDGTYLAKWRTRNAGEFRVRAVLQSASQAVAASASSELAITVHRAATATWYGPGFYGRQTACGIRMTRTLLGVAHRKYKCGTKVAVLYHGRRITVPVVDRGPFRRGTDYDLTAATAQALGFDHTDRLGAIRLHAAP